MQRTLLLCVLLILSDTMNACNICSCSSMGSSLGILPQFRSHFLGLRETYRTYNSSHPVSILNPEGGQSNETYYNTELWGRWYPHKRIQVFAFVPYNQFSRTEKGETTKLQGFGDISLLANYLLINTPDSNTSPFRQALLAGGGLKLNSGKYDAGQAANFQLGTGAKDVLLNLSYTARYKSVGFSGETHAQYSGTNSSGYQWGNKLAASSRLFAKAVIQNSIVLPYAGLLIEKSAADKLNRKLQDYTGGKALFADFGCDLYIKNFQVGAYLQKPLQQNIGEGFVKEGNRLKVNFIYHFKSTKKCQ